MTLTEYFLLLLLPVLAGLLAILSSKSIVGIQNLLVALSGSFLFGITILDLGPQVLQLDKSWINAFVLIGFLLQVFSEYFSKGIEHGHVHAGEGANMLWPVMIGLSIHSLIEGIPLTGSAHASMAMHESLFWAILLHKLPAAFALGTLIALSKKKRLFSILILFIFACLTPISSILTQFFIQNKIQGFIHALPYILALVAGSFLHISTTLMFESGSRSHHFNFQKLLAIVLGFIAAILIVL